MTTTTATTATTITTATQSIQITPHLTFSLTTPATHHSPATGASLTGTWLWPSSLLLAHYISSHLPTFSLLDKSILELGAGYSGLPGLTAAGLGARRVTLTDIPPILPLLSWNARENAPPDGGVVVEVRSLVWGEEEEEEEQGHHHHKHLNAEYDVVLMSDVFYDVGMMGKLGRTLRRACGERTRAFGASEAREWTWECLRELEKEGFEVVEVGVFGCCHELWSGLEGVEDGSFAVYEFVKREDTNAG